MALMSLRRHYHLTVAMVLTRAGDLVIHLYIEEYITGICTIEYQSQNLHCVYNNLYHNNLNNHSMMNTHAYYKDSIIYLYIHIFILFL